MYINVLSSSVLVWLTREFQIEWVKKMEDVLTLYYEGTPRKIMGGWKKVFDNCPIFTCVEHVDNIGSNVLKVIVIIRLFMYFFVSSLFVCKNNNGQKVQTYHTLKVIKVIG